MKSCVNGLFLKSVNTTLYYEEEKREQILCKYCMLFYETNK